MQTNGVPAQVFIDLQDRAVHDIEMATMDLQECATKLLDAHGCGTSYRLSSIFVNLHKLGIGLKDEKLDITLDDPFINRAIGFVSNHILRDVKHKARIPVPSQCPRL